MKVSIDKRNDDDILYQGSIIEFEFDDKHIIGMGLVILTVILNLKLMSVKVIHGHSIEVEFGPSCPNPGIRRELEAQGKPYMCTSDIATWIGVDNKWYYVYRPGVSTSIIPLLELTKDEDEMFDYLKDISEFVHENPHN